MAIWISTGGLGSRLLLCVTRWLKTSFRTRAGLAFDRLMDDSLCLQVSLVTRATECVNQQQLQQQQQYSRSQHVLVVMRVYTTFAYTDGNSEHFRVRQMDQSWRGASR